MKNPMSRLLLAAAGLTTLLIAALTAPYAQAEWSLLTTTEKRDLF